MKKFTQQNLEEFFESNFIEDDDMFEFLKGRTGELSLEQIKDEEAILTIKLKLLCE